LLYSLANCHILELNMMAELDRSHRRITVVGLSDGQIPLEDGQRSLLAKRQHDIQRKIIRITVDHPVRKNPEIFCLAVAAEIAITPPITLGLCRPNWTVLADIINISLNKVIVVLQFAIQAGMDDVQILTLAVVLN